MHFFHKLLSHKQPAVSEWNSEDFKRILDQNPSSINGDNGCSYKTRRVSGQTLKNQVRDYQLVDHAFETRPKLPYRHSSTLVSPNEKPQISEHKPRRPKGYKTTSLGAIEMGQLKVVCHESRTATMTAPRGNKKAPQTSASFTAEEIRLIDQLGAQGYKVHHLDYATLTGVKGRRRHYWLTPINSSADEPAAR